MLKGGDQIVEESGLIAFDGEVIVGFSGFDEVDGKGLLSQEGVGTDRFAFDADGVKEGDGGFDFVGAL